MNTSGPPQKLPSIPKAETTKTPPRDKTDVLPPAKVKSAVQFEFGVRVKGQAYPALRSEADGTRRIPSSWHTADSESSQFPENLSPTYKFRGTEPA
jgi:hypothetical protein